MATRFDSRDLCTGRRRVVSDPAHAFGSDELAAFDRHFFAHPLVHVDSRLLVSLVLNRKRRDFSERERALLDIVRPHLAALYRNSYALAIAQRALAASGDPAGAKRAGGKS